MSNFDEIYDDKFVDREKRKLTIMADRLSAETHKRFDLIKSNMLGETITIDMITINMRDFYKMINKEEVANVSEGFKAVRLWIFNNMYRVLNKRLIYPNATQEVCEHIKDGYITALDIFLDMSEEILDISENISHIVYLLRMFFTIDTNLKIRYQSRYDFSSYILNTNTYLIDGSMVGSFQSSD